MSKVIKKQEMGVHVFLAPADKQRDPSPLFFHEGLKK